ncbi:MAG: hypothetical protein K2K96_08110 [Lachnospiraceae bacterium]|nr:hypothetical protein [Lachnospiraceae bacterium]
MINRDIDLLDALMDQECEMFTTEGKVRQYQYQRDVIAEIWGTKEYTVTLYHYDYIESPYVFWNLRLGSSILGVCELRIVDAGGKEYQLVVTVSIRRNEDGRILHSTAYLDQNPTRWGL